MLAPGDAAVLAHILRTDPHLHPPRHPDRLTTNTYLPGQIGRGHHRFTLQPWGNPNQSQPTTTPDQQPTSAPTPHAQHHPATPAASTPCYSPQAPPPAAATYDHRQSRVALRPSAFLLNRLWPGSQCTRFVTKTHTVQPNSYRRPGPCQQRCAALARCPRTARAARAAGRRAARAR